MKTVLRYLKPFYNRMTLGLSIKVFGTVVELALPYILSHILKNVVVTQSVKAVAFWGLVMIVCAGIATISNIIANRMAARVASNFSKGVRSDFFDHVFQLSASQTDSFTIASLESRITNDTYNIHHFVGMMQRMGVRAPILLIGGITITMIMDRFLALVMISMLPFIFILVYFISKKGIPLYTKVQESVDKMIRVVREDITGIRVIKALSKTEYESRRYDDVNTNLVEDEEKAGITMGMVNPVMMLLMNIGIVAVIALSANRISGNRSSPETVVAFVQYFTLISMAMMSVTRIFIMYTRSSASARRIAEVLETKTELDVKSTDEFPKKETDFHIEFDDVCFSYRGTKNVLADINFKVAKGGSLGIIGATGSGKSTIIKLLMRLYDVNKGSITIDGQDIRTIPHKEFYTKFGVVFQNDFIVSDTIEENIRFGRELSKEKIVEAAKIAQADDFIDGFADKYSHILAQKGTNISGGQRQRVLIARAVAAKPEILILDDSSSALDYRTDANLRKALASKMKNSTIITVAQRVSSIKDNDTIIVLDDGKIIGMGDHGYLLENCKEYSEISESQMGGAIIE